MTSLPDDNTPDLAIVRQIEAEIAKHPLEIQHRVRNTATAIREFVHAHGGEGHLALALVGAKMAAGVL